MAFASRNQTSAARQWSQQSVLRPVIAGDTVAGFEFLDNETDGES